MLRIPCPWCGLRDETEFRYRGEACTPRPAVDADLALSVAHVYERGNPRGWQQEWWLHVGGCHMLLRVERHTLSHEIRAATPADAVAALPGAVR